MVPLHLQRASSRWPALALQAKRSLRQRLRSRISTRFAQPSLQRHYHDLCNVPASSLSLRLSSCFRPAGIRPDPQRTRSAIYRPVEVRIVEQLQGPSLQSATLLAALGGQIGRDVVGFYPSDLFAYALGERALVFLDLPEVLPLGTENMPVYKLMSKYVLAGDDRLHDVYPDRPYSGTFRQYTWQDIRSTIAAQAPVVPTATR